MMQMRGFLGNRIMINGSARTSQEVSKATYRFRILNGSNSRIYKLAWNDGSDMHVIATDGGRLSAPRTKEYVMLAPGERIGVEPGARLALKSLAFRSGITMGMGGMMGDNMQGNSSGVENGVEIDICSFEVTNTQGPALKLSEGFEMININRIQATDAVNRNNPRTFRFYNERMQWVINGRTFEMTEVAEWEKVKLNTTEVWEFVNGDDGGGMGMMQDMMRMPHPVHIHGLSFLVLSRDVSGMDAMVWNSVRNGFVDEGWQDTFLLMPGMKVQVIMRFADFTGTYIYHCHNLEHEDMGMMRNYEVVRE
jgi:FtsP/CotA-like multicopper oxidase with cupredoxin domain